MDAQPGGPLRLSFEPLPPDPRLESLRLEEAHEVLDRSSPWKSRMQEEFLSRYGPPLLPLPQSLETSRLYLALKLSPRYMGAGVREAARELFSSSLFLSSVALSVFVYFAAWLAPEPVFTKAFVTALTLRLALAVGVLELSRVARACVQLYQEAEAAKTVEQLEAVAERFGKAMGGLLRSPRFSLPEGLTLEGATTVQMVADGTVLVAGVAAGTAAATGSACSDGANPKDGYYWHHLATNKNDTSTLRGGPWTPRFEELFELAGMRLDAKENLVYLKGHKGPHPEEYHQEVHRRLEAVLARCRTPPQCRAFLVEELKKIANDVCTPGTALHRLLTRT
ncbi:AHH domain-containing protein [Archangium violaceum]|uniref:AHH domain-containing protein n=1 Tax=Archangium violaceum TaxID=83451 RepID=UPI0037BF60C1